jgi:MFS family permease
MLSSIHPLGERAKGNRWWVTASSFVAGALAGGLVAGGVAGMLGWAIMAGIAVPSSAVLSIAAIVMAAAVAFDLRLFGLRLPSTKRQVDENWLNEYRGWVYGVGYGVQLGSGVVTVVNSAAVYATFALAFLTGSVAAGLVIGGTLGLLRGVAIVPGRSINSPHGLHEFHRRLDRMAVSTARLAPVGELVVALSVAATIVTR